MLTKFIVYSPFMSTNVITDTGAVLISGTCQADSSILLEVIFQCEALPYQHAKLFSVRCVTRITSAMSYLNST